MVLEPRTDCREAQAAMGAPITAPEYRTAGRFRTYRGLLCERQTKKGGNTKQMLSSFCEGWGFFCVKYVALLRA